MSFFGLLHLGEEFLNKDDKCSKYPRGAFVQGIVENTAAGWTFAKNNLCEEIGVDPSQCKIVFKHTLDDGTEVRKLVPTDKEVTRVR